MVFLTIRRTSDRIIYSPPTWTPPLPPPKKTEVEAIINFGNDVTVLTRKEKQGGEERHILKFCSEGRITENSYQNAEFVPHIYAHLVLIV